MSRRLRSGKIAGKAQKEKRERKISLREEETTKEESAMSDTILEELKSL